MIIEYSEYPFINFRFNTDSLHKWLPILSSFHLNWSDQTRWGVDILLKYPLKNVFSQANRPFSKMAAENSNWLKLAKIKNVYQHKKEHLHFSKPVKFQRFRCNISWENVRWKLKDLQTFV